MDICQAPAVGDIEPSPVAGATNGSIDTACVQCWDDWVMDETRPSMLRLCSRTESRAGERQSGEATEEADIGVPSASAAGRQRRLGAWGGLLCSLRQRR